MARHYFDIHHHLLYGMDDGPKKREQMYAMLDKAAEQGISHIIATPHVVPGVHHFRKTQYETALREAREYCSKNDLRLTISSGAEILYTRQASQKLQEREIPSLCGTEYILVEFSPDVKYRVLYAGLEDLCSSGYVPILAHTERYSDLMRSRKRIEQLKRELRVKYQVNCSTVLGKCGFLTRIRCNRMFQEHLIDAVATDAHNVNSRPAELNKAWNILMMKYGKRYALELTDGTVVSGSWSEK